VQLDDGTKLLADLYIDCSGTSSQLLARLNNDFACQRTVYVSSEIQPCAQTGPAYLSISGIKHGWQSVTTLREHNHVVSLTESTFEVDLADGQAHYQTFALGHRNKAWHGNCPDIENSAYALEPISPASYILLKKDIERLLELIPVGHEARIERQQYNRQFQDDVTHAELFHRALYAEQRDVGFDFSEKLDRKLTQYLHRVILASYVFEPFNKQDWAILHAGFGKVPKHFDRMAEQVDFEKMQANLDSIRAGFAHLATCTPGDKHTLRQAHFATSMPSQHIYL
jgi:tryptophan halogenase